MVSKQTEKYNKISFSNNVEIIQENIFKKLFFLNFQGKKNLLLDNKSSFYKNLDK